MPLFCEGDPFMTQKGFAPDADADGQVTVFTAADVTTSRISRIPLRHFSHFYFRLRSCVDQMDTQE